MMILQLTFQPLLIVLSPMTDDQPFSDIIRTVELGIEHGIYPERIYQGSSGSYFAKDAEEVWL